MPDSQTIAPGADAAAEDSAFFAELEAELQRERVQVEALNQELQTELGEAEQAKSAPSADGEAAVPELAAWQDLLGKYGPGQLNADGEISSGPASAPVEAAPPPVEPGAEAEPESSPSSRPVEPGAEAAPESSPSSRPVEPGAEAVPESSPSSRPVEPAPSEPSILAAGAFALGAGAVLAGGAAALARPRPPTPPAPEAPAASPASPAPTQSIAQWFYADGGTTFGPFELDELLLRLREGRLGWETPVWTEGMAAWTAAKSTELSQLAGPPSASTAPPVATAPTPSAAAPRRRRFCHSCGAAAEPGDRFCTNCGTALRS